jgi:hypothetical protein
MSEQKLKNKEPSFSLYKSCDALGKLTPILKDSKGNIIDGFHRHDLYPDWPAVVVQSVDDPVKLELARLAANYCRRIVEGEELSSHIGVLVKAGLKPEDIAEQTGISIRTIYNHMPQELKNPVKVEARLGKVSDATVQQTVKTADITVSPEKLQDAEEKARASMSDCQGCHMGTREDQLTTVDGKRYCPHCAGPAKVAFENEQKRLQRIEEAKQKPASPKSFDTWEQRKANMSPHDSAFQQEVFVELASEGLTFEQNVKLPVVTTEPDGLRRDVNLLVYLDCTAVHQGKRLDKDEQIRELFKKHHPEVTILGIPYTGNSEKEKVRVKQLIHEAYDVLKGEADKFDVPTTGQGES